MTPASNIVLTVRQAATLADMDLGDLAAIIGTKEGPRTLKAGDVAEWLKEMEAHGDH